MATIFKREDAHGKPQGYQAKIRRKGFPTLSKVFTTKADAEAWAKLKEAEMIRGAFIHTATSERITIGELCERYWADISPFKGAGRRSKGAGARTEKALAHERWLLDRVKLEFGLLSLAGLQASHVAKYRDRRLKEGRSPGTINHVLNMLSVVIDAAAKDWGYPIQANPLNLVKRASTAGRERDRRLTPGEEGALIAAINVGEPGGAGCRNPWVKPAVQLAIETAMRQGELIALVWENVDLKAQTAYLPLTKNGEARTVPLSTRAVSILESLPTNLKRKGRVLSGLTQSGLQQAFQRAVERARRDYVKVCLAQGSKPDESFMADLRFHDLRHEAASRLFERHDLNVIEAASVTGHKTLSMLQRYTHLRPSELAKKLG